ncbi:NAD(P)/FAD-dependent oxidoreductase [Halohasta litorea]|uniref:NAD(P)/FAD-dependent oxidoreductase n=1 Tax=Halohasta litorea TaxID=869891 RepID=A0ABD6DCK5_9EURY|nr:NAD(P)/FAD-dependent oxidoreductase [Halohasta litorea]
MSTAPTARTDYDHDIVIVGGGPAGCSAGVFCAREGLDTAIFDRGRSSIQRCGYLENYLGFPAGVDIGTFYKLIHDHAETAGCTVIPDLVESVDRLDGDDGEGFTITPQEGEAVTAQRVIAATRYDGSYLRGLDSDEAMIETVEHDGEAEERFDREYPDEDGSTPVDGLYVATPAGKPDKQAILAAGRGAHVGKRAIVDARIDDGWWEDAAEGVDWVRQQAELDDEWQDRDTWVEWFDDYYSEDAPVDPDSERFKKVRAASIDDSLSSYITDTEIDDRTTAGHERLAEKLDPEAIVDALDSETLLEAMDDDEIRAYLDSDHGSPLEAQ